MSINEITYTIRMAIYEVHKIFGPGLLENVYEAALERTLQRMGLKVRRQVKISIEYDGEILENTFRIDLLVEDSVIIEIKSVEQLAKIHFKQTLNYLNISGLSLAILVNFNCNRIIDHESIFRFINSKNKNIGIIG